MVRSLSDIVRRKAEVAGAQQWLADLPSLVAELERRWQITVGDTISGGTEAYVAHARSRHDVPVVLKVVIPRASDEAAREITALRLAGGTGCVRLIDDDVASGALLLERLGRPLSDLAIPSRQRQTIMCDLAARVWRPAAAAGLPTGAEKGRWLAGFITSTWDALGRPCSERTIDHALACAARRISAHDDERARLVHGDVHQWNTLESADGFALIDPDGLLAEPEYDLGVLMREDPMQLLRDGPEERAHRLAARCGLDPVAVWEWGVVERVSTGLLATMIGLQPVGAQMLHVAETVSVPGAGVR
jgi:streptomycin 6-kinase